MQLYQGILRGNHDRAGRSIDGLQTKLAKVGTDFLCFDLRVLARRSKCFLFRL